MLLGLTDGRWKVRGPFVTRKAEPSQGSRVTLWPGSQIGRCLSLSVAKVRDRGHLMVRGQTFYSGSLMGPQGDNFVLSPAGLDDTQYPLRGVSNAEGWMGAS